MKFIKHPNINIAVNLSNVTFIKSENVNQSLFVIDFHFTTDFIRWAFDNQNSRDNALKQIDIKTLEK